MGERIITVVDKGLPNGPRSVVVIVQIYYASYPGSFFWRVTTLGSTSLNHSLTTPGCKLGTDLILNVMLLNELSYRQDKRMDELNLFIEHYSKYIVSII